jgi:hypothetical protein
MGSPGPKAFASHLEVQVGPLLLPRLILLRTPRLPLRDAIRDVCIDIENETHLLRVPVHPIDSYLPVHPSA